MELNSRSYHRIRASMHIIVNGYEPRPLIYRRHARAALSVLQGTALSTGVHYRAPPTAPLTSVFYRIKTGVPHCREPH